MAWTSFQPNENFAVKILGTQDVGARRPYGVLECETDTKKYVKPGCEIEQEIYE